MEGKRLWVRRIAALSMLLLLLGTLLSFVIAPRIQDARTREMLGDPDAYVTDTKRSPWITVDETGMATLYTENMVGMTELVIPDAVNGVKVTGIDKEVAHLQVDKIKTIVFPAGIAVREHNVCFQKWQGLEIIVFSEGITDLSKLVVSRHPSLRAVYIPRSCTALCPNPIRDCGDHVTVYYAGNEEEWVALGDAAARLSKTHVVIFNTPVPEY